MNTADEQNNEYLNMMNIVFKLGNHQIGKKITDENKWILDVEALTTKLFNHIGTIFHLRKGTGIHLPYDEPRKYFDHASVSIIIRATFETYLTFYYLFSDLEINQDAQQLRYLSWKLRGLLDRQSFRVTLEEHIKKLEEEKKLVDILVAEIKNNPEFELADKKEKKMLRTGQWRVKKSWADLSKIAGFNEEIFRNTYRYLCSYSHSGSLSTLQIGDAENLQDQFNLTKISMHYGLILMCHFANSYMNLFPESKKIYEQETKYHFLFQKWLITWHEEAFLNP